MRRSLLLGGIAFLVVGCHQSQPMTPLRSPDEIAADYKARMSKVAEETKAKIYWPNCEPPAPPDAKCGMLFDGLTNEHAVRFIREECHEDPAVTPSDDCIRAYREAFLRDVRERYTLANDRFIGDACANTPSDCTKLWQIELLYLKSHNETAWAEQRQRMRELVEEHEREQITTARARQVRAEQAESQRRALAAFGAALQGMGQGLQNSTTTSQPAYTPNTPPPSYSPPSTLSSSRGRSCSNDFECGGPGYTCAKPVGSFTGECAKAVNSYGNQDFLHGPRLDSNGPGQAQCRFMTDCPIGFRCDQGRCMKQ